MKYYFPIRGERYVPSLQHALTEMIDCIIHNRQLATFPSYQKARQAGERLLIDDDTFSVFCIEQRGVCFTIYCVDRKDPEKIIYDYVFLPKEIKNYIYFAKTP